MEFENGIVSNFTDCRKSRLLSWNEHSTFKGVFLKHLIKGADTAGNQGMLILAVFSPALLSWK